MGSKKDIPSETKIVIRTLLEEGNHSQRQIAAKTGVSVATVAKIAKAMRNKENIDAPRPSRRGCNKATSLRDERKIQNICTKNRKKPLREIGMLVREAGINISDMTVRRRIKDLGYKCYRPLKKPLLTTKMMKERLAWAKSHKNWTTDNWNCVSNIILSKIPTLHSRPEVM